MQLLCVAALLLSAVAAQPDSRRPWQDEQFPPAGGPRLGADSEHGDDEQSVTPAPEDGDGSGDSGHPTWAPGFMSDSPGVPLPGSGRQFGRHRRPSRGNRPNRRNPGQMVFSPTFKVDNVIFQNTTDVTLKEGENIFVTPKGGRGPHHHRGGRHGPPKTGQYVKLIYNATELNTISIEFGVFKPMNLGELVREEENPEEDY